MYKMTIFAEMKVLKEDITKLKKLSTYAKEQGLSRGTIYAREKVGTIKIIEIDGVKFVKP